MTPRYDISSEADTDIQDIFWDSAKQWGIERAARYIEALHQTFENLAEFPHLGKDAGYLRRGYLRFTSGSHMIYFQKTDTGIFIVRILHQQLLPETNL